MNKASVTPVASGSEAEPHRALPNSSQEAKTCRPELSQLQSNSNTFPKDPRDWTRDHVIVWLLWATSHYKIEPVNVEKFHMNGRGLTYLTKDGFLKRAPAGGEKLFEDFQRRFAHAILQERNSKGV